MYCAECEDFELRRDHPFRWAARKLAPQPASPALMFAGAASVVYAALGGPVPPSHYERHREEYARTGDPLEMERMLRQVTNGR